MYKGEPTKGIQFFNLLFESDEFCAELGKVTLAAGRLEAELILFLNRKGITENVNRSTLGKLISIGKRNALFDRNLTDAFETICKQRNYLTHNIYALFVELIDETILDRSDLLDSDVQTYMNRVWQLRDNLIGLANIIHKK